MRAALLAPIFPRVMEKGESKKAALILMKNSHFDRTLQYYDVVWRILGERGLKFSCKVVIFNYWVKLGSASILTPFFSQYRKKSFSENYETIIIPL